MSQPIASQAEGLARVVRGPVVARGDREYDAARTPWNMHEQSPSLVLDAVDAADVAAAVQFAAAHGLRVCAQATGHSATGGLERTLLVRTGALREAKVDAGAARATVGSGAHWRDLQPLASSEGLAGLAGTAPHVSVTGYTLGGGVSWLGRRHGLCANRLQAADIVTADGVSRRVDEQTDSDLLWALRGGGGNFGIVTRIELGLVEVPELYAGNLVFPLPRSEEILSAWREWVRGVPREVTSLATVLRVPDMPTVPEPLRGAEIIVVGACLCGDAREREDTLAPLRALGPIMDTFAPMRADGLGVVHNDPEDPMPDTGGAAVLCDVTDATIERLMDVAGPRSDSPLLFVELRHLGGAVREPEVPGGACDRLEGEFLLHALGVPAGPRAAEIAPAVDRVLDAVAPDVAGRLPLNFVQRAGLAPQSFDPAALARLRAVKARVDPDGMVVSSHQLG